MHVKVGIDDKMLGGEENVYCSPLRYPGGKAKLAPFMERIINKQGLNGGTYIEPFAGGAGIALELLDKGIVNDIVINDYDKGVYSFWRAILTETDRFVQDIRFTPLTVGEWEHQHEICMNDTLSYSYELGFATFYMNRTNHSGIIKGGIIGGVEQNGIWKMDARFHREHLIKRIERISAKKKYIHLYNKDIVSFILNYLPKYEENALVYFDPPYYQKGKQLYLNYFDHNDHVRIKKTIEENVKCDWIITYDDNPKIAAIYKNHVCKKFDLTYTASSRRSASEIIIFKSINMVPVGVECDDSVSELNLRDAQGI